MLYTSLAHIPFPTKPMDGMKKSDCSFLVIDNFLLHKSRIGVKCTCGLKGAFKYLRGKIEDTVGVQNASLKEGRITS